jgi:hypothetical protein
MGLDEIYFIKRGKPYVTYSTMLPMQVVRALFLGLLSISSFSAFSATANIPSNSLESRLDRQLKSWQKRLGLDDWNLSVRVVRQSEIDRNTWGQAEWDPEAKTGVISVLDPRDYNLKGGELRLDMECTIVHELIHIQVSPLVSPDVHVLEDVVNRLMGAVMNRPCPN